MYTLYCNRALLKRAEARERERERGGREGERQKLCDCHVTILTFQCLIIIETDQVMAPGVNRIGLTRPALSRLRPNNRPKGK